MQAVKFVFFVCVNSLKMATVAVKVRSRAWWPFLPGRRVSGGPRITVTRHLGP